MLFQYFTRMLVTLLISTSLCIITTAAETLIVDRVSDGLRNNSLYSSTVFTYAIVVSPILAQSQPAG